MNYKKRFIISMVRNKGRTLLFVLLLTTLLLMLVVSVLISEAIQLTTTNLRQSIPAVFAIETNHIEVSHYEDMTGDVAVAIPPSSVILNDISSMPNVLYAEYSQTFSFWSDGLSYYDWTNSRFLQPNTFKVKGVSNPDLLDAQTEIIKINEGRTFSADEITNNTEVVVISKQFARYNNLHLGDTITLSSRDYDWDAVTLSDWLQAGTPPESYLLNALDFHLEIIGIFDVVTTLESEFNELDDLHLNDLQNLIYAPFGIVEHAWEFIGEDPSYLDFSSKFVLCDALESLSFIESANAQLPQFWHVQDLSGVYGRISYTMDEMNMISDYIKWGAFGFIAMFLLPFNLWMIHERRHEIGVYLALGENRGNIVKQLILENIVPLIAAFIVSIFLGRYVAEQTSVEFLRADLAQQEQTMANSFLVGRDFVWFNPGEMTAEEMIAYYEIPFDKSIITFIFIIPLSIFVVSTFIISIYVMRFPVKDQLTMI